MTAQSDDASNVYKLPERPSADSNTQSAPPRTREESGHAGSRLAWAQRTVGALLSGESLVHRQPPSLAQEWDRHVASARHFNAGLIKGPRLLWGVLCLPLSALEMVIRWVRSSPPLALVTILSLFLIHLFI